MKSKDVMKLLDISRSTLYLYVKSGKITGTKLHNGYYNYNEDSVFKLMKNDKRNNVIYARVSTYKQRKDLQTQINNIQNFCKNSNYNISHIYSDISSGLDFDRNNFSRLLDDVIKYKIKHIFISHKDRLTRLSFRTIKELFLKYGTKIVTINDTNSKMNDNEIFEELISLMHIFSTTLYSRRRKNKINIYKNDIKRFICK